MIAQAAISMLNLGARRLAPADTEAAAERDLDQARDAIDGARALIEILERRIPQELAPLRDALSQLQMAYAREIREAPATQAPPAGAAAQRPAGAEGQGAPAGEKGPGAGEGPSAGEGQGGGEDPSAGQGQGAAEHGEEQQPGDESGRRPGPAESSGRLWVPGS